MHVSFNWCNKIYNKIFKINAGIAIGYILIINLNSIQSFSLIARIIWIENQAILFEITERHGVYGFWALLQWVQVGSNPHTCLRVNQQCME